MAGRQCARQVWAFGRTKVKRGLRKTTALCDVTIKGVTVCGGVTRDSVVLQAGSWTGDKNIRDTPYASALRPCAMADTAGGKPSTPAGLANRVSMPVAADSLLPGNSVMLMVAQSHQSGAGPPAYTRAA